jgi:predicted enzyme related to lactoylglutathione lyase
MTDNMLIWVEIPVADFERAKAFYEAVFETELMSYPAGEGRRSAMLQTTETAGMGISILETAGFQPSKDGVLVYFNAGEDLAPTLMRVDNAGGEVVMEKQFLGASADDGYFATFRDTEGNTLALFSMG